MAGTLPATRHGRLPGSPERTVDALRRQRNAFEPKSHENAGTFAPVALTPAAGTLVP